MIDTVRVRGDNRMEGNKKASACFINLKATVLYSSSPRVFIFICLHDECVFLVSIESRRPCVYIRQ